LLYAARKILQAAISLAWRRLSMVACKPIELAQFAVEGKRRSECAETDAVSVIVRISVLLSSTFGNISSLTVDRQYREKWGGNRTWRIDSGPTSDDLLLPVTFLQVLAQRTPQAARWSNKLNKSHMICELHVMQPVQTFL
jgi:hypothetical protein